MRRLPLQWQLSTAALFLWAAVAAAAASATDFDFLTEFLKLTVDLADLVGLHMIMQRFVAGKGTVKILVAGVGWAFAEFLLTRVIFLWVSMFLNGFVSVLLQISNEGCRSISRSTFEHCTVGNGKGQWPDDQNVLVLWIKS